MDIPQQTPIVSPPQAAAPPINQTANFVPIQNNQQKKGSPILIILIAVFALILLIAGGGFLFVYPKIQIFNLSKQTLSFLPAIRTQVSNTGDSLKKMYSIVTGESQSQSNSNTLLRLNVDKFISQLKNNDSDEGEVAGASTKTQTIGDVYQNFVSDIKSISQKKTNKGSQKRPNVMGESTALESARVTLLRKLKDAANQGSDSVSLADNKLKELMDYLNNTNIKSSLGKISTDLETNNQNTKTYLDQAGKTTSYYSKISDIQIKLEPLLASYNSMLTGATYDGPSLYLDRIQEIDSSMNSISNDINKVNKSDLPQGLEDLHNDNLKVVDILSQNIKDVQFAMKNNDGSAFTNAILLLGQQLEPLSTRAISLELSFWQNNEQLTKHTNIVADYQKQETELNKIIKENKLPFFTN